MELLFFILLTKSLPLNPPSTNPSPAFIFHSPNLKSLPDIKIPTLLSEHSLSVTTLPSGAPILLNNIKITHGSLIYDDGFLIIFKIENDLKLYLLIAIILVALASDIFYLYFDPRILAFYLLSFQILKFDLVPMPDETHLHKKIWVFYLQNLSCSGEREGKW
ncbi:hypothetical protein EV1_022533 [Malus domestica]